MGFGEIVNVALPLAAVMVPAFVLGFGAVWLALHNGLTDMRKELADVRKDLTDARKEIHGIAERVARIEGRLDPPRPAA